jgi:hypothetical protein
VSPGSRGWRAADAVLIIAAWMAVLAVRGFHFATFFGGER